MSSKLQASYMMDLWRELLAGLRVWFPVLVASCNTRPTSAEGAAGPGGEWITTDREGRARQGKKSMVEKGGRKQMHD